MPVPYYDSADGRLLNMLSDGEVSRYLANRAARAIRAKSGRVVRLYSIPRERAFDSVAMLHAAASQTTQRMRDDGGVIIAPPCIREHKRPRPH